MWPSAAATSACAWAIAAMRCRVSSATNRSRPPLLPALICAYRSAFFLFSGSLVASNGPTHTWGRNMIASFLRNPIVCASSIAAPPTYAAILARLNADETDGPPVSVGCRFPRAAQQILPIRAESPRLTRNEKNFQQPGRQWLAQFSMCERVQQSENSYCLRRFLTSV